MRAADEAAIVATIRRTRVGHRLCGGDVQDIRAAPELIVQRWFNTEGPLSLADLRGRVLLVYAFQMLCPGCVQHSIPQAREAHDRFDSRVQVVGLHTVFEHHEAMGADALLAFIGAQDLRFPIGIDAPSSDSSLPRTMRLYDMQGTPTLVVIDAQGRRRYQRLGHVSDAQLEALVASLLGEQAASTF